MGLLASPRQDPNADDGFASSRQDPMKNGFNKCFIIIIKRTVYSVRRKRFNHQHPSQ
jgi:hypothetical protein